MVKRPQRRARNNLKGVLAKLGIKSANKKIMAEVIEELSESLEVMAAQPLQDIAAGSVISTMFENLVESDTQAWKDMVTILDNFAKDKK